MLGFCLGWSTASVGAFLAGSNVLVGPLLGSCTSAPLLDPTSLQSRHLPPAALHHSRPAGRPTTPASDVSTVPMLPAAAPGGQQGQPPAPPTIKAATAGPAGANGTLLVSLSLPERAASVTLTAVPPSASLQPIAVTQSPAAAASPLRLSGIPPGSGTWLLFATVTDVNGETSALSGGFAVVAPAAQAASPPPPASVPTVPPPASPSSPALPPPVLSSR